MKQVTAKLKEINLDLSKPQPRPLEPGDRILWNNYKSVVVELDSEKITETRKGHNLYIQDWIIHSGKIVRVSYIVITKKKEAKKDD